jgi:hypothetical protein
MSDDELDHHREAFQRSIRLCDKIFGEHAFEKPVNSEYEKKKRKNPALFEAWTVNLANIPDATAKKLIENKDQVFNKLQEMIATDGGFLNAISTATQKPDSVSIRHEGIRRIIQEVANA